MAGDFPNMVVAPFGCGSNFAGISFPFLEKNLRNNQKIRCIEVEPASCPKLTRGEFRYDFGDTGGMTPLLPMYTLGHDYIPLPIHAGGLRYHGASVIVSQLLKDGLIEATSQSQKRCFKARIDFIKSEGIIPAPEATHAIATVIGEARRCKQEGTRQTILFNLCGHGYFELASYASCLAGELAEQDVSQEEIIKSVRLPMPFNPAEEQPQNPEKGQNRL